MWHPYICPSVCRIRSDSFSLVNAVQIGIFAAERSRKCHKYTKLYEAKLVAHCYTVLPINRPGMQSLAATLVRSTTIAGRLRFTRWLGVLSRRVLLCFTHRLSIFMACLIALVRAASQAVAALAGFLGPRYFGHYTVQNSCYHFLSFCLIVFLSFMSDIFGIFLRDFKQKLPVYIIQIITD